MPYSVPVFPKSHLLISEIPSHVVQTGAPMFLTITGNGMSLTIVKLSKDTKVDPLCLYEMSRDVTNRGVTVRKVTFRFTSRFSLVQVWYKNFTVASSSFPIFIFAPWPEMGSSALHLLHKIYLSNLFDKRYL